MSSMNEIMAVIFDKVKSNKDIQKILFYSNNDVSPFDHPDLTFEQAKYVSKYRIFTRKKIPSVDESKDLCCYISMRYGQKIYHHERNQYFNGNTFNFYVLCHNDFDENEIIGSRVCEIERLIAEMFDDGEVGTVCRTRVNRSIDVDVNGTDYSGRQIEIVFSDFNGDNNG